MKQITVNDSVIRFIPVLLNNIEKHGKNSNDNCETYRRLSDLSNDFTMLTTAYGPIFGRIIYWCPVYLKASSYIKNMKKKIEKNMTQMEWILVDQNDLTVGLFGLSQLDLEQKEKYALNNDLRPLKLYNVGIMLHTDYQRKGICSELLKCLPNQITNMNNLDIEGLFVVTRTDNIGMNTVAKNVDYPFLKKMDAAAKGVVPCISKTMSVNIYVKLLTQ